MARILLSTYTIRLRLEHKTFAVLSRACGGKDIFHCLRAFLKQYEKVFSQDKHRKKLLRVSKFRESKRVLEGVIETGEYGYESRLLDTKTHAITHERSVSEAEMLPFYFLFYIPEDVDEGILVLQRFGQYGIRKVLLEVLKPYIEEKCGASSFQVNPLVPKDLLGRYIGKGRVTKVRLISHKIPDDVADAVDKGGDIEEIAQIELTVKARRNGRIAIREALKAVIEGKREASQLMELEFFEYDNAKVEVDIDGNRRTVDLSNLQRLRAYYDVTDSISLTPGGHPQFDSISSAGYNLLGTISSTVGLGNPND